MEHRHVKRNYTHTNKNNAIHQMTLLERREHILQSFAHKIPRPGVTVPHPAQGKTCLAVTIGFHESEPLPATPPDLHHYISHSQNFPLNLIAWIATQQDNPAVEVSIMQSIHDILAEFVLCRISYANSKITFSSEFSIQIKLPNTINTRWKTTGVCHYNITVSTAIRLFESTTQHTMCGARKTV